MVDKKTLHGNYVRLYNDFISTPVRRSILRSTMDIMSQYGAYGIERDTEKEVNKKGLTADKKKKVQNLIKTLNDNDNNIVMFAKLKQ